jgi:vitamin B12 transporter
MTTTHSTSRTRIMHRRQAITAVVVAAVSASALKAQQQDTTQLRTVVVSASKVPQPASALTQAVTVIKGEDLRARGVTRVSDALREVPGAMLAQSGSFGSATSLFLRGGESRYTKILIDGVPINASGGSVDLSNLTTDNIDRIEIVRGPASVLYGADAVTGVVQIFTRKASGPSRASLGARGGSYGSLDLEGDAAISGSFGGISIGAAHHSTDGILPFNNQYRNGNLSSSLNVGNPGSGEATISSRYTTGEFHFPTDFAGRVSDTNSYGVEHRLTLGLDAGGNLSSVVAARVLAGTAETSDLSEDIATPFGATEPQHSAFRSRAFRRNAEGRLSFFLPAAATLTVGANYEAQHEHSSNAAGAVGSPTTETDSFDASRHDFAYYSELIGNPGDRFAYTLSGRLDDNSDYRRFGTYRAGLSAGLFGGVRVRASLSTAFNAPAFSQLRPTLYTVGSPDLSPERSRSSEIGVAGNFAGERMKVSASYFNQKFTDLIQYVDGGPPDFKGSYANLTAATSNGLESELSFLPSPNWRTSLSYTIVNPKVSGVSPAYQGTDKVGDALIRRPTHSGSFSTTYLAPSRTSLGVALTFVGRRPDLDFTQFPSPRVTLPSYKKLDLSVDAPITLFQHGGLEFTARAENALNKRYEDVFNFKTPGRTILFGIRAGT